MPVQQPLPDGPFAVGAGTPPQDMADLIAFLTEKGNLTDLEILAAAVTEALALSSATYGLRAATWVTGRAYVLDELVVNAGTLYRTTTAHTSGATFAAGNFTAITGAGGGLDTTAGDARYVRRIEGGREQLRTLAAATGAVTVSVDDGNVHDLTLTGNATISFAGGETGAAVSFTVVLRQDATGGRTVTWPSSVVWADAGSAPTLTTTPSGTDLISFLTTDGGVSYFGFGGRAAVSSGGGGGTTPPAPPNAPNTPTATAGVQSATINFVPNGTGPVATSYTATSSPGGLTGTGTGSPITVTGLTAGTAYTFTLTATNAAGTSGPSVASNSVTPTAAASPIPTAGLRTFFEADQITGVADGGQVQTWPDSSGNSLALQQATAANRPLLRTTSAVVPLPNGKPVVDFNAVATSTMVTATGVGVTAQPFSVFLVAAVPTLVTGTNRVPVNTGGLAGPYLGTDNTLTGFNGSVVVSSTQYSAANVYDVTAFIANNGTSSLRRNGVVVGGPSGGTAVPSGPQTVGSDTSGGAHWFGYIAAVVTYNRVLTAPEVAQVENYLKTKYGTP